MATNINLLHNGYKECSDKLDYEIDWAFIKGMAERMSMNKCKYPPYNWKKPIDKEKLIQSLTRHFVEIQLGNFSDEQDNGHVNAIACNAMMLAYQLNTEFTVNSCYTK